MNRPLPRTTRRTLAIAGVAALAGSAALVVALAGDRLRGAPSVVQSIELSSTVVPGRYVEHDVRIDEQTRVVPFSPAHGGGAASASAALEAVTTIDVRLRLDGVRAGDPGLVRARFVAVRAASTRLGAQELIDTASLVGPVAEVEIGRDGLPRSIRAPHSDDPTFARVLTLVLNETAFPLGSGASWQATERSARGTLASTVVVDAADAHGAALVRTRVVAASTAPRAARAPRAPTSAGETRARVRTDGVLLALDADERFEVFDSAGALVEARATRVHATLAGEGATEDDSGADGAPLAAAFDPASAGDEQAIGKRSLERRTEGLTREALDRTMADAIVSGRAPDHAKFLWRASARLKLDDAAVDDLVTQFEREDATTPGRALALDLLAAASSAHAQEALVALVQLPVVEQDPEASRLKQRLALVPAPTPATIDFLIAKSKEPSGSWRDPARIALGAAVRHRRELGDVAEAARARAALVEQVSALEDDRETEVAVLALGNTYDPELAAQIVAFASSPRAQTRHVVAEALREIDAPLARDTLLALARDAAPEVSRRALASLARHTLDDGHLATLASSTAAGAVPDTALNGVVSVVEKRANDASARAVLDAVLAREPEPQLAARVRHLLRGI